MKKKYLLSVMLLVTFILASVYVVILAQGTKFDGGSIVNTSILRINSTPEDVVVYVNGEWVEKKENRIEWLQPGEVTVTLKKEGYRDWEKTVTLKAGFVEDIFAQLYPVRINFDKVTSTNVDRFYFSETTDYIFYTVLNGETEAENGIWRLKVNKNIFDIGDSKPSKIYSFLQSELNDLRKSDYTIKVAKDNSRLVLDIKDLKKLLLFDVNNPNTFVDVTNALNFYPSTYNWYSGSSSLIISNGKLLLHFDVASLQSSLIYYSENNSIKFASNDSVLYYYNDSQNEVYRYQGRNSSKLKLPKNYTYPEVIDNIFVPKDLAQMLYLKSGTTLTFMDTEKEFFETINGVEEVKSVAPNARGVIFIQNNQLSSIVIKDSIDFKSYTSKIYPINLELENLKSLNYTPSSKNILALTETKDHGRVVWFMDYDGFNKVELIKNERIFGDNVNIVNNNIDIYLTLQDSSVSKENVTLNNIYRFKLEAKQ